MNTSSFSLRNIFRVPAKLHKILNLIQIGCEIRGLWVCFIDFFLDLIKLGVCNYKIWALHNYENSLIFYSRNWILKKYFFHSLTYVIINSWIYQSILWHRLSYTSMHVSGSWNIRIVSPTALLWPTLQFTKVSVSTVLISRKRWRSDCKSARQYYLLPHRQHYWIIKGGIMGLRPLS